MATFNTSGGSFYDQQPPHHQIMNNKENVQQMMNNNQGGAHMARHTISFSSGLGSCMTPQKPSSPSLRRASSMSPKGGSPNQKPLSPMAMSPPQQHKQQQQQQTPIMMQQQPSLFSTPTNNGSFAIPTSPFHHTPYISLGGTGKSNTTMTTPTSTPNPIVITPHFNSMMPPPVPPSPVPLSSPFQTPSMMGPPMMGPPTVNFKRTSATVFESVSRAQTLSASSGAAFLAPPTSGPSTPNPTPPNSAHNTLRNTRSLRKSVKDEEEGMALNEKMRDSRHQNSMSKQTSKRDLTIYLSRQKSEIDIRSEQEKRDQVDKEKKRIEAIKEVLTSESTYLNHLNTIVDNYLIPLRKECSAPEEVKFIVSIFSNIESIRETNREIHNLFNLRIGINPITKDTSTSDLFFQILPSLNIYTQYYVNWYRSLHYLDLWLVKCKKFQKFIEERSITTLNLKSLLIMPCQRIPRYTLLIDAILRFTSPTHPDYIPMQKAMTEMKLQTEKINESIRDSEKLQLVTNIRMRFESDSIGFLDQVHRRLVKESGEFQLLPCKNINQINDHYNNQQDEDASTDEEESYGKKNKKQIKLIPSKCHLYLFNDLFVIGVPSTQNNSGKMSTLLKGSLATTVFKEYPTFPHKFSVHHNNGSYILSGPTKEDVRDMLRACDDATTALLESEPELREKRANITLVGSDTDGWSVFDPSEQHNNKYPIAQKSLEEINKVKSQIFTPKKRKSMIGKLKERTKSLLGSASQSNSAVRRTSSFVLNSFDELPVLNFNSVANNNNNNNN
ncbi:pleckstrin domain-containing protein [Cavenderia fasciculata]|uniref:Pleckstrin domain-containing protein n=1 Tax=Cavenderia fasciculata TaxID=261658 RepID=F4PTC2_CACFS|nr:pleckstrin domain-containing protein [Cavenderia fasciculata]EGG21644.1 pleckstrin domain-containing protein [Cavenderia fasciculata]|eukprot:XP_004359494.1 pleckstrin domain-containing protein [Cavenderia fasciculata]